VARLTGRCALWLAAGTVPLFAQSGTLDGHKSLFAVLAAINAAGYDAGLDSNACHPLRKAIRAEIAKRNPPVVADIRDFMRQHRQQDDVWELRIYISLGLLTDGPPKFNWRIKEYQLPPDVASLKEMIPLLQKFSQQAGIEELWRNSQPAIEEVIARYQPSASKAITEISAYLRAPLGGTFMGRTYQVVIDLLGAPNQIHSRAFLDDFFLVVTHSAEPQWRDIRHSYAQYLLDPLFTRHGALVEKYQALGDYAQGAPFLPDHYKQDFLLFSTKCLIRAIESRLEPDASRRQALVDQAMGEGYILTAHFAEQLPAYEKQETAMSQYFPALFNSINLRREERRMTSLEFSSKEVIRKAKPVAPPPPPELSPAERSLEEAEDLYAGRKLDEARAVFQRVLGETDQNSLQGKAYYGLGRIAALKKDPETAEKLFLKALELGPPPAEKSWTLVFLGRLSMLAGEVERAAGHFDAARKLEGASPKAKEAAEAAWKDAARKLGGPEKN